MASNVLLSPPDGLTHGPDGRMAVLLEASETAAKHTLDFDALMVELARLVGRIIEYEMYSVLVPNEEGELYVAHSEGFPTEAVRNLRVPVGTGLTGKAARSRATVRVGDVTREPAYLEAVDTVRSELSIPLVARGRLVAVLDLQSTAEYAFDSQVSDVLELVASRFSLAIDVAQLYRAEARQRSILSTLRKIAHEFSSILRLGDLLPEISALLRTLLHYDVLAIYLKDPDQPLLRHYFGIKYEERLRWRDIEFGQGLVGTSAATREVVAVSDTRQDPRYLELTPGILSEVAIPLVLKNQLVGVLDLEFVRVEAFSADDVNALMLLAPQIATAIENARLYEEKARNQERLEQDLIAARALQSHILPGDRLHAHGVEIAARNEPASLVSGDFYDFYLGDDSVAVLNGDISGKGAAAALYAALASGLFRTAVSSGLSPADTLRRVNGSLVKRKVEARFLAAHFLHWDVERGRLVVAGAGMPPLYVCGRGRLEPLRLEGFPLGLFGDAEYEEFSLAMQPGDFVVSVSDGLCETLNEAGESYGDERVGMALENLEQESAATILEHLFEEVRSFCRTCPQQDDQTAVVLHVTG